MVRVLDVRREAMEEILMTRAGSRLFESLARASVKLEIRKEKSGNGMVLLNWNTNAAVTIEGCC